MSALAKVRAQLVARREEQLLRLQRLKESASRENDPDWSEQAQERQNDEVVDALGCEVRRELLEIGKAIERIDQDEYGECVRCGRQISPERLNIMPYALLCVRCAEQEEQRTAGTLS